MVSRCWTVLCATLLAFGSVGTAAEPGQGASPQPAGESSRGRTRPLEQGEEQRALGFARQFDPDRLPRLEHLKVQAMDRYNVTIRRLIWIQKHLEEVREREDSTVYAGELAAFQRMFLLQSEAEDITVRCRNTTDARLKAQLRAELTSKIAGTLEIWEQIKQGEIQRMEADLQRLKRIVEERERDRATIVERRVRHMLGEAEDRE